jgi:type I restriction enzyme S subunit
MSLHKRWKPILLGKVIVINPSKRDRHWPHDELDYIDISSVAEGYIATPPKRIPVADAPSRAQRLVKDGDTVLSTVRPNRRSMFFSKDLDEKTVVSTGFAVVRPKEGFIHPRFLYALIFDEKFTDYLVSREQGAAYPAISPVDISSAEVHLPPYEEQERIGSILGSLDDKIELNRRMSATLEEMARALFKSWFIDFDPVHAKAEGRPTNLPPEMEALFPEHFIESHFGNIPEGWSHGELGDIMDLEKGLSYKGEFLSDHGVPMVNLGCFKGKGRFDDNSLKYYTGDYKPRHVVYGGDLVIANTDITQKREVIGSPALLPPSSDCELLYTHHVFAARFNSEREVWKLYVYYLLLQDNFRERAAGFATGTTVLALPRDAVNRLPFLKPTERIVGRFNSLVAPFVERSWQLVAENRSLMKLRDTLLPKLISGEIALGKDD